MLSKRMARYLMTGFFYLAGYIVSAQDQRIADSLVKIYHADTLKEEAKMELLRNLSFNEVNDLRLSLQYAEELINLSRQKNNSTYLFHGYFQKGNKQRLLGNFNDALDAYFKSAEAARKARDVSAEGSIYAVIADVYRRTKWLSTCYNKDIVVARSVIMPCNIDIVVS